METESKTGALIGSWIGQARALIEKWSVATTVGTFLLYFFGYLSLRFHLSAIGIATDLAAIDERYLFGGARFLVNLLGAMPFALPLFLAVRWIVARTGLPDKLEPPARITASLWFCIVTTAVLFLPALQLMPLDSAPSGPLLSMVLEQRPGRWALFVLQIAAWMSGAALWARAAEAAPDAAWPQVRLAMSTAMLALMALLLPVNYGIVVERYVAYPACQAGGERGWMIWEGKSFVHYIVQRSGGRAFLTVPAAEVKRHELSGAVNLLPFLPGASGQAPADWGFCAEEKAAPTPAPSPAPPPPQPAGKTAETPKPRPATTMGLLTALGFGPVNVQGGVNPEAGEVWEVRKGSAPRRVASGSYLWPVAQPGTGAVFALADRAVVRAGGPVVKTVPGVRRLAGFVPGSPDELVLWDGAKLGVLNVRTGEVSTPEGAPPSWVASTMAAQLRSIGSRGLEQQRRGAAGADLYDHQDRIADCEGDFCGQPSLAPDGRVLFIRTPRKRE